MTLNSLFMSPDNGPELYFLIWLKKLVSQRFCQSLITNTFYTQHLTITPFALFQETRLRQILSQNIWKNVTTMFHFYIERIACQWHSERWSRLFVRWNQRQQWTWEILLLVYYSRETSQFWKIFLLRLTTVSNV